MSVNGASTIVGNVSWVTWGGDRLPLVINKVLVAFIGTRESDTVPTNLSR
jgi:hypothetical protein